MKNYDVVIVGGGPGGLSAALLFGRARRTVLLSDAGVPRNAAAEGVHNFVTRDGISPRDFRIAARADIAKYGTATFTEGRVVDVRPRDDARMSFDVVFGDDTHVLARRVILATGVVDELPTIPGVREQWGRGIFTCPYCHGWELRERPWGIFAESDALAEHALLAFSWTDRVTVFTNGHAISPEIRARLESAGAKVEALPIERVVASEDGVHLDHVELRDGSKHPCAAMMLRARQRPTALVEKMKLAFDENGYVKVDGMKESSVPGVYVVGDASTMRQAAIVAASDGMTAGAAANFSLTTEVLR